AGLPGPVLPLLLEYATCAGYPLGTARRPRRPTEEIGVVESRHEGGHWELFRQIMRRGGELSVLAGDQIIGQREAGHRLEAGSPGFQMGPLSNFEPALGHEHHAAPATDICDR